MQGRGRVQVLDSAVPGHDYLKIAILPILGFQVTTNADFETKKRDFGPVLVNFSQNFLVGIPHKNLHVEGGSPTST